MSINKYHIILQIFTCKFGVFHYELSSDRLLERSSLHLLIGIFGKLCSTCGYLSLGFALVRESIFLYTNSFSRNFFVESKD
jgi:hypothetical protein